MVDFLIYMGAKVHARYIGAYKYMWNKVIDVHCSTAGKSMYIYPNAVLVHVVLCVVTNQKIMLSCISCRNGHLCTPLDLAVDSGHAKVISLLIKANAFLETKDKSGVSACIDCDVMTFNSVQLITVITCLSCIDILQ